MKKAIGQRVLPTLYILAVLSGGGAQSLNTRAYARTAASIPKNFEIPVLYLATSSPVPGATSVYHLRDAGASWHIASNGFAPGSVVNAWWLIFNKPENCTHPSPSLHLLCSGADLTDPATVPTRQWADAQIVHDEGEISMKADLPVGDTTRCDGACNGLIDVFHAEYHVFVRTHGPVIPSLVQEQLNTFNGGCLTGEPNVGLCTNLQGSAFRP